MSKTKWLVLLIVLVVMAMAATAQKPQEQLPGRVPMHNALLRPSPEWVAYYDIVPEGERSLYWTTLKLLEVAREQATNITELDKRVKALEARLPKPVEPNKPADPNGKAGTK